MASAPGNDVKLASISYDDITLIERWLAADHVRKWWPADIAADVMERLRAHDVDGQAIIEAYDRKVGYLTWGVLSPVELEVVGSDRLPPDSVDIDIMIGETDQLGHGIGPRACRLLVSKLLASDPTIPCFDACVSIDNHRSLGAVKKAGFEEIARFVEPDYGRCALMVLRCDIAKPPIR